MRKITDLHPELQKKIAELTTLCEKNGLKIKITECLRTVVEQDALYAQGRTQPGSKVTNAKGSTYSSQHQWGIAADFCRNDGKGAFNEEGQFFYRVGALARSVGLGWGGDWKSPVDKPHLYLPQWGSTTTQLKAVYGTPEKFMATWVKTLEFELDKVYKAKSGFFLWETPGKGKIKYKELSPKLKKKCRKTINGKSFFLKGKKFRLIKTRNVGANVWGKIKAGYWVPLLLEGKTKAVKMQ